MSPRGAGTVTIKIIGDAMGLTKELDTAENKLGSFGDKTHSAMGKVAGAIAGLGIATYLKGATQAAAEDEAAQVQLATAMKNATNARETDIASVEKWISKQQMAKGFSDTDLRQAITNTINLTHDQKKAQDNVNLAMDLARAKGMDLVSATDLVNKAWGGNIAVLSRSGILTKEQVKEIQGLDDATKNMAKTQDKLAASEATLASAKEKLSDLQERLRAKTELTISDQQALRHATEDVAEATKEHARLAGVMSDAHEKQAGKAGQSKDAMDILTKAVRGQADAYGETAAGQAERFRQKLGELTETIGAALLPAMEKLLPVLSWLIDKFSVLPGWVQAGILVVGGLAVAIGPLTRSVEGLGFAMKFLSDNPIVLVIAAIAAVAAGVVYAYKHFETFRNIVDGVARAVVGSIQWIVDRIGDLINAASKIPKTINNIPGIGVAKTILGFGIPGFQEGGIVPGPIGAPRLALVHGGEQVIPVGRNVPLGAGGGTHVYNITVNGAVDPVGTARQIHGLLQQERRRSGPLGLD